MLLRSKKIVNEIISVPGNPAEIVAMYPSRNPKLSDEQVVTYLIDVDVDLLSVLNSDAYNLYARMYKKKPEEVVTEKRLRSARSWKKRTKRIEKNVRKAAEQRREKIISERRIDLTKYISNDLANLKKQRDDIDRRRNLERKQANSLSSLSRIVKQTDPFSQNIKSLYKPTTPGVVKFSSPSTKNSKKKTLKNKNLSNSVPQKEEKSSPASNSFSRSFLKIKKDPASITAKNLPKISKSLPKPIAKTASSFVFFLPTSLENLPLVKVSPPRKRVSFYISVLRSVLNSTPSFYLELELENRKGVRIDKASTVVPHARILNSFITPRIPPLIEAEYTKPGIMSVKVKPPKDRMAKGIKVFRRTTSPVEGGTDIGSQWETIFQTEIEDTHEVVFKDYVATSRPVVYRALSYGENFKPSEDFSSTVVLPLKQFRTLQTGSLTAVPRVDTQGSNTFTSILVKDIPDDVVTVMLRRYDLSAASDSKRKASTGAGFVYVGHTPVQQTVHVSSLDSESTVLFTDLKTKTGKTYSFVPVGITRAGKQIIGSSAILEIPVSPSRSKVNLDVSSPELVSSDLQSAEISFKIYKKFTEFGFSEIRQSLESGGQKSLFDAQLLQDRDKFESLINCLVERRNSRTGEEESFGVIKGDEFIDNPELRTERNVKPLEPGVEYTYTFTALVSSAEELFPTLKRSDVDMKTLRTFSRRISKFQNPLSINRATLQSTSRQSDKSKPSRLEPTDPLVAGRTDVQITHEMRFPVPESKDENLRVEEYKKFNRVVWRTSRASTIDHFKIYVVSSGGKVLIDTVHCDDSSSEFYYRHYDSDYGVNYKYVIQPVDLNYNEIEPIYSKTIKAINILKKLGMSSIGSTLIKRL